MNKAQKAESIEEIKGHLQNSTAVYLVDYQGINVADINEIRSLFRKEGITYKIYKNTLLNRAFDEVGGYDNLKDLLVGMTGVIFAGENYVAPAKIINKYYTAKKKFSLKGCVIESQFFPGDKLDVLASMPTKDEVMAAIVGSIASPASGIVGAINAVMRDIVSLVDEIGKKKAA